MKRILKWILDGHTWMHIALTGLIFPFAGAYIFFTEPGMDWRIDLITAIIFFPFLLFIILTFRSQLRKQLAASDPQAFQEPLPMNPIEKARSGAR